MPGAVPKAVLDTQLVVRGLVRRRKSAAVELFDLALERVRMVGVTSPLLLEECESVLRLPQVRVLTNPPLDDDLIQRAIGYIGERFTVVAGAFKDMDNNHTIAAGLTQPILEFERIQQLNRLSASPNAKTVVIGENGGGAPVLLSTPTGTR